MVGCKLADFDVMIKGERSPYVVTAFYRHADQTERATANGDFAPDILMPEWHAAYQTLAQSMNTPDTDAIQKIGAHLWAALMRGQVRDLWVAARREVEQGVVDGLRLRLDLQSPHVAALPWESLYDPDRNTVFATHHKFALVRVATLYSHVGPNRRAGVQLPLRILIAAPIDPTGVIDSAREISEIRQIASSLREQIVEVHEITGEFTITELRKRIAKLKPTILHFIGHGDPNGLWLWPRGRHTLASTHSLRSVMENSPSVKLAFLNACLAGRPTRPRPFSGVADQMMQAGVAAVIAMQYQIRDGVAINFAQSLYGELLDGSCPGMIDLAMNLARGDLYTDRPGDFSYGTPILWLNRAGGCIFSLDMRPGEKEAGVAESLPIVAKSPTLNLQEESEWIEEMVATTNLEHLTGELRFLRSKWLGYVDELRSLIWQLGELEKQPDGAPYAEKVAEYRRYKAALRRVKRLIEDAHHRA
jgi:hypothetical protein